MDDVAEVVLAYIPWADAHPLPADAPTVAVLADLRRRLDAACPEWRWAALQEAPRPCCAVAVAVHLTDGRTVRGALTQRPSAVEGGREAE